MRGKSYVPSRVKIGAWIDCILYTAFLQYGVYDDFSIDSDSLRVSNCEFLQFVLGALNLLQGPFTVEYTSILLFQYLHKFEISKLIVYWSLFKFFFFRCSLGLIFVYLFIVSTGRMKVLTEYLQTK